MFAARAAVRGVLARSSRSYGKQNFVEPHMNELPVPNGSWQEMNAARQRKNNAFLAAGVGVVTFSIFVMKSSGLIYFNWSAPDHWE